MHAFLCKPNELYAVWRVISKCCSLIAIIAFLRLTVYWEDIMLSMSICCMCIAGPIGYTEGLWGEYCSEIPVGTLILFQSAHINWDSNTSYVHSTVGVYAVAKLTTKEDQVYIGHLPMYLQVSTFLGLNTTMDFVRRTLAMIHDLADSCHLWISKRHRKWGPPKPVLLPHVT